MKKLIFEYSNSETKTEAKLWFYPVRFWVITILALVGFIVWKVWF